MEAPEQFLDRAMKLLQRSDPIPKLLPQVRFGRMPKDSPALTAILDSWLEAFIQVLKDARAVLDIGGVLRLDPNPRLAVLVEAGVLAEDHPLVKTLRDAWSEALRAAQQRK
jgi:hypothetical protein